MKSGSEKAAQIAFGKAMRKFREAAGISQEKLALTCGIHRTYIGGVERGERNISIQNMARIAVSLHVPLSKLVIEMEKSAD
ncbi:MAG: helix-turn-helix transcriptional regulator [Phycisphaerales bacterium]|nr:helix-turn-helix transcriptional regulator [Phycisphaerales bacterium]